MFRFTIRDVLWLTIVVGLACGWFIETKQRGPENVKLRTVIDALVEQKGRRDSADKFTNFELANLKASEARYRELSRQKDEILKAQYQTMKAWKDGNGDSSVAGKSPN